MSNKNNQNIEQTTNKSLWKDKKNKNYLFFIAIIFFLICPLCARGFDMKELLPIKHNVFIKGPKMHVYHNGPAVLMNDGNVLVIGGNTQKAEIYDYKKNKFVYSKGEMKYKRDYGATATTLKDGSVLITGGAYDIYNKQGQRIKSIIAENAEIYNPKDDSFDVIGKMCIPRIRHTSILMDNGNVLFFGGNNKNNKFVYEIEEFDLKTKTFKINSIMNTKSNAWTDFLRIDNNQILMVGPNSYLIYDYLSKKITPISFIKIENTNNIITELFITQLKLNAGISHMSLRNSAIILTKHKNKIINISQVELPYLYRGYTSIKLDNDKGIFIGGYYANGWGPQKNLRNSFFVLSNGTILESAKLNKPRYNHISVQLRNGNILILSGFRDVKNNQIELLGTELYYR